MHSIRALKMFIHRRVEPMPHKPSCGASWGQCIKPYDRRISVGQKTYSVGRPHDISSEEVIRRSKFPMRRAEILHSPGQYRHNTF